MRLSDFLNLESGPRALIRLALYPLVLLVACQAIAALLSRLRGVDFLLVLLGLALLSPVAYAIRERRRPRRERGRHGRSSERAPVLPHIEEEL